jgi:hypothetical protein
MTSRIRQVVTQQGEERFQRDMEEISSAERREVFELLNVPRNAAGASARQRTARRIHVAWERLAAEPDDEAAEVLARHWLARHRMDMIRAFLDRLEVPHRDGYLQDDKALTDVPRERMVEVLRWLAQQHEAEDVRLYAALMDLPDPDGESA